MRKKTKSRTDDKRERERSIGNGRFAVARELIDGVVTDALIGTSDARATRLALRFKKMKEGSQSVLRERSTESEGKTTTSGTHFSVWELALVCSTRGKIQYMKKCDCLIAKFLPF